MLQDYLSLQLNKTPYELIDDQKRYYGEIHCLRGVLATGNTLEECRQNLLETLEGWLILRFKKNLPIPGFSNSSINWKTHRAQFSRSAIYV